MNKKLAHVLTIVFIGVCAWVFFVGVALQGIDKEEVVYCNRIEGYSKEYDNFTITKWESEMCKAHGFNIKAPTAPLQ
jgi:hypothetical protein